jgi:hypothetical protein
LGLVYRDLVPALHWITVSRPADPSDACTIFAAQLPLRFHRHLPRLLWFAFRIHRQLLHSPGIVGYAFDLEMRHKTLWTVSAWADRAGLVRFEQAPPHRTARRTLGVVMLPSTFVVWTCRVDQLPVRWHETRERLGGAGKRAD